MQLQHERRRKCRVSKSELSRVYAGGEDRKKDKKKKKKKKKKKAKKARDWGHVRPPVKMKNAET